MSDKYELHDEELDNVSGGRITYTWDGHEGSLGMNGVNKYKLFDKNAFLAVYNEMFGKYSDADIIRRLREKGIIKKP